MIAVNRISNAESAHNIAAVGKPADWVDEEFINEVVDIHNSVTAGQLRIAGILIVAILLASIVAAWLLMHFGYTITEEKHQQIVDELENRHKKDFA